MAKKAQTNWEMSEEQRRLFPAVSGNTINGLGESEFRRPSIVYWPNDFAFDSIPHGELCKFMLTRSANPEVGKIYSDVKNRAPKVLDDIAQSRVADTPENWSEKVKEYALTHEADLVGIAALDPAWFFDQHDVPDLPWVIVFGARMRYEMMENAPPTKEDPSSAIEVGLVYNRVDRIAGNVANWIRSQGYYAENQGGPSSGKMNLIPAALEAGLGELGKHGSIINRKLGSLLRLSAVRTDMPLIPDHTDNFGVDDFCANCQVCSDACPPDAIFDTKQKVRGAEKWYVDFDKCVPYFNENQGCAICIAVCPWSRPGIADNLVQKMARRKEHQQDQNSS